MLFMDFIFSGPLIKILFSLVLILAPTFFSNFISVPIILGFKLFICKLPFASVAATQNVLLLFYRPLQNIQFHLKNLHL
ncbi:MAG: hypothetical protein CM1200mP13_10470 [Candidatus Pelagibacterales bacterium]|nr:MAG: hypothetical protein CM1200mP13_10470 [Pelagibacterales bacterium]